MLSEHIDFKLVLTYSHRLNTVERAIGTFKYFFIAVLGSLDTNFLMHLWGRPIDQVWLALNLMSASHINTYIFSKDQMNGDFDFNKKPLAPPGKIPHP